MLEYFHAWNCVFEGLPRPFWNFLKHFSDLNYAWEKANLQELSLKGLKGPYLNNFIEYKKSGYPFKNFESFSKKNISAICFRDTNYPQILRNLNNHLPPAILYIKGTLPQETTYLSVVGTRDFTSYGEQVMQQVIKNLAGYNLCIVSGLARGIDTLAHENALQNNLPTIAVLGYGHEKISYYQKHLCNRIENNGALISEYPPYMQAQKYHFPLRNRIISGLSKATLVIEAGEKSGARITANYALDQGRDVMAIPGDIYRKKSQGTNGLIAESTAHLVRNEEDILSILGIKKNIKNKSLMFSFHQKRIIDELSKSPLSRSDLIKKTGYKTGELNAALTELELENYIKKNRSGNYFITY